MKECTSTYSKIDQRDLNSIYFKNEIQYDPSNYSLKYGMFLDISRYIMESGIYNVGYHSECTLCNTILEFWGSSTSYDESVVYSKMCEKINSISSIFDISKTTDLWRDASILIPINNVALYKNGLHISSASLVQAAFPTIKIKAKDVTDFKRLDSNDFFNAVIQLCIALKSSNSITKYLAYIYTNYKDEPLINLINLRPLKTALETKDVDNFKGIFRIPESNCSVLPNLKLFKQSKDFFKYNVDEIIRLNGYEADEALMLGIINYITFGLEVLYHIYNLPNTTYSAALENKLAVYYESNVVNDYLYFVNDDTSISYPTKVKDILNTEDNSLRFIKIKEYVYNLDFSRILDYINNLIKTKGVGQSGNNEFLAQMTTFAHDLCFSNIRISYILELQKYCEDNKLLDDSTEDSADSFFESLGIPMEGSGDEEAEESTSVDDLLKPKGPKHSRDLETESKDHNSSKKIVHDDMYDELDKSSSAFTYGEYDYEFSDIYEGTAYKDKYLAIAEGVKLVNKKLIKQIKNIKVYNTGGKNPGLDKGKLDMKNIYKYKTTDKIFYNNTYKIKESDLAFGIILDASGSMWGDGIKNGKITMIVLHETLKALGINHSIITHTSYDHHQCTIERYQSFKEDKTFRVNKNYALANIDSHSGNCDSAALCYMEKALLKTHNKDKICLIFSDGQPTECTDNELRLQVKHMESKGIKTIGIGIDFPDIKRYYPDNANGKNLVDMLNIVTDILKRYVLEKE